MDFDSLVDRYQKPIYNLVLRLVGDRDEAADLTQDTFVAAYKSFGAFRGEASAYTWLYRIAINNCKNRFKSADRRRMSEAGSLDAGVEPEPLPANEASSSAAPHAVLERKELQERIERAIGELPGDYRIVAVLRDLHGLSYKEIAQVAGLKVEVVRTRLARARDMLRRKLLPYISE